MYSFKEKIKHLHDLMSPEHAQADYNHLKEIEPNNINILMVVDVEKSAEKILFNLLDLKSREEIVTYRRNSGKKVKAPVAPKTPKAPKAPKASNDTKAQKSSKTETPAKNAKKETNATAAKTVEPAKTETPPAQDEKKN